MGSSPTGSILQVQYALKRKRTGQLELLLLTTFWVSVPLYWQLPSPLTKNTHASPQFDSQNKLYFIYMSTCGLVAMTSASHAEGRQFDPGQVYSMRVRTQRLAQAIRWVFSPCCHQRSELKRDRGNHAAEIYGSLSSVVRAMVL